MSRTTRNSNIKLITFLLFGCALLGGGFYLRMKYPANEKQSVDDVRILIKSETAVWNPQSGTQLYLRLSGLKGSFEGTSAFILKPKKNDVGYWAPVDPMLKSPLFANTVFRLSPPPDTPIEVLVNPLSLRWGKSGSAVWPDQQFFDVVQPGKYSVGFEMSVRSLNGAKPGEWKSYSSNPIDVEVSK